MMITVTRCDHVEVLSFIRSLLIALFYLISSKHGFSLSQSLETLTFYPQAAYHVFELYTHSIGPGQYADTNACSFRGHIISSWTAYISKRKTFTTNVKQPLQKRQIHHKGETVNLKVTKYERTKTTRLWIKYTIIVYMQRKLFFITTFPLCLFTTWMILLITDVLESMRY